MNIFLKARRAGKQLLLVDAIRNTIAAVRFFYFVKIRRRLKTFSAEGKDVAPNTISHNLWALKLRKGDLNVARSSLLIRPVTVIETVNADAQILSIGPRTEGEILNLMGHGFKRKNIAAIDLISYSPWIQTGDMHQLPYADKRFDVLIAGWVLAYSENRPKAAAEMLRVVRNGGIIAVSAEFNRMTNEKISAAKGYLPGSTERLLSVQDIHSLFEPYIDRVFFEHDITGIPEINTSSLILVFSTVKK
jgi:SAM-dependent methyltransferase